MTIYILIILAIYTIIGILLLEDCLSLIEKDESKSNNPLLGLIMTISGVIAIIFQTFIILKS